MATRHASDIDPCAPSRCRLYELVGEGEFQVPRHIVRIDQPTKRLHGWQVRFETPSKFFPDSAGRGSGSPERSLSRAKAYLRAIWVPVQKKTCRGVAKRRGITDPGIRVASLIRANGSRHWYVEAMSPRKTHSPKRFYIGTDATRTRTRTRTRERERQARVKARAYRKVLLRAIPVPLR